VDVKVEVAPAVALFRVVSRTGDVVRSAIGQPPDQLPFQPHLPCHRRIVALLTKTPAAGAAIFSARKTSA
jgi:hypothetical protein